MSRAGEPWWELVLPAPADQQDALVVRLIGPGLAEATRAGEVSEGLFLREPGPLARSRLIVQARGPADGAAAALRRLAALTGGTPGGAVRTAAVVPLSGSAFAGPALGPLTRGFLAAVTPTLVSLTPGNAPGRSTPSRPARTPGRSTPGRSTLSRSTLSQSTLSRPAPSRSARLAGALDLLAAHLPALGAPAAPGAAQVTGLLGGAPLSFLSFRSHAEAFIATSRDPEAARRALDERFEAVRRPVELRVAAVLDQLRGAGPAVSKPAAQWHAAVRAAKPLVLAQIAGGGLTVHDEAGDPAAFSASSFHTVAGASAPLQEFLHSDPAFLAVRLLTSLLYLSLHHLGLSLAERYFLCHATARACESVFGVDAVDVLAGLSRA